jgi:hypothetical protein
MRYDGGALMDAYRRWKRVVIVVLVAATSACADVYVASGDADADAAQGLDSHSGADAFDATASESGTMDVAADSRETDSDDARIAADGMDRQGNDAADARDGHDAALSCDTMACAAAGGMCGADGGACDCPVGHYACGGGCCTYTEVMGGGYGQCGTIDVAATRPDRWSVVVEGTHGNGSATLPTLWLVEQSPAGLMSTDLNVDGAFAAIDLDGADRPHVAFLGMTDSYIRYRTPAGTLESISCPGISWSAMPVAYVAALVVDRTTGVPHVAWAAAGSSGHPPSGYMMHSQRDPTGAWSCDIVATGGQQEFTGGVAIALDGAGDPVIAYMRWDRGVSSPSIIEMARGHGSGAARSWTLTPVATAPVPPNGESLGPTVAVGMDPSSAVLLSYQHEFVATGIAAIDQAYMGTTTRSGTVDSFASGTYRAYTHAIGALSDGTQEHVLFIGSSPMGTQLYDAVPAGGAWHVDAMAPVAPQAAAAVDGSNVVHTVYCDGSSHVHHLVR